MSSYVGPVEIIAGGIQASAYADLQVGVSGYLREWGGTVDLAIDGGDAWTIQDADQVVLRLPDGTEGHGFSVGFVAGSASLRIRGNGSAPF
ncbi:hypothetical protein ACFCX4_09005 [Kitasatospora sp. NPDC056327]|uniref:hypothetical protein n=1 Tax=Kitasatospora sp. NPDC056327 TaxID=3345785 RepID=UPI0035DC15D6